jgi:large-conductance mechanosensitive channel
VWWSNATMGRSGEAAGEGSSSRRSELGWGRPDVSQPRCGWALIGAAVLGVIGGLTPWAYVHGDEVHRADLGIQLGWLPVASAIVVATMGALIVVRRGATWVSVTALVLSVFSLLIMILVGASITLDEARKYSVEASDVSVGYGVWLTEAGALLGVAFAVWALRRRTANPADEMHRLSLRYRRR